MILEAKSQLTYDVLDPTYIPADNDDHELFVLKQNYIMSVFKTHILTDQGKSIITTYTTTGKAQQVWKELVEYHKKSTQADNVCEVLLKYIVTSRGLVMLKVIYCIGISKLMIIMKSKQQER